MWPLPRAARRRSNPGVSAVCAVLYRFRERNAVVGRANALFDRMTNIMPIDEHRPDRVLTLLRSLAPVQVKNVMKTTMRKQGIHPEWHEEAKVVCNGEEVLVTSGTQSDYNVDIWSGNHPFFQGITSSVVTDEGRVNRFKRRFEGLDSLSTVETASEAVAAAAKAKK
jgi:large subunit ribosomal protein L31